MLSPPYAVLPLSTNSVDELKCLHRIAQFRDLTPADADIRPLLDDLNLLLRPNSFCKLFECSFKTRGVRPYNDAITLILDAAQDRRAMSLIGDTSGFVLSAFDERYHPSREIRAFVFQKRLSAMCAYRPSDTDVVIEQAIDRVKDLHRELVKEINAKNFVMDAVLLHGRAYLVELNPFGPETGGLLFDWEQDGSILRGSELTIRELSANFT